MKVKPKRIQVKKTEMAPPPPAPPPAPSTASDNPAEVEALGFNAFINKEFDKALEYYEQVLAIDPNFPGAAAQRDKCLEALGR
jgi:tetratricopeptide (TPR) repeat protein